MAVWDLNSNWTGNCKACKNHLSEKAIKAMYEVIN
jgi:hypothetical protein